MYLKPYCKSMSDEARPLSDTPRQAPIRGVALVVTIMLILDMSPAFQPNLAPGPDPTGQAGKLCRCLTVAP
jgi:hypothetical protein